MEQIQQLEFQLKQLNKLGVSVIVTNPARNVKYEHRSKEIMNINQNKKEIESLMVTPWEDVPHLVL